MGDGRIGPEDHAAQNYIRTPRGSRYWSIRRARMIAAVKKAQAAYAAQQARARAKAALAAQHEAKLLAMERQEQKEAAAQAERENAAIANAATRDQLWADVAKGVQVGVAVLGIAATIISPAGWVGAAAAVVYLGAGAARVAFHDEDYSLDALVMDSVVTLVTAGIGGSVASAAWREGLRGAARWSAGAWGAASGTLLITI